MTGRLIVMQSEKGRPMVSGTPQLALPVHVEDDGEIRLYKFTFPYLPPSKNVYDGWPNQWKQSAKKKWVKAVIDECEASCVPKGVPKIGLAATLVFGTKNRRDPQNYAQALWHWVPDALQKYGLIDGDHEGKIDIPANWGLKFAYDLRRIDKKWREKTVLAITMVVPR